MRRTVCLVLVGLLWVFGRAEPVAAIEIDGIEYLLFARTAIKMQDGVSNLAGVLGVNEPGGLLRIGAFNTVFGVAIADHMFFGTRSEVFVCGFNASTGIDPLLACGISAPSLPLPITAWPPVPAPVLPPCVESKPNIVVPVNGSRTLSPGCYGDVRVRDGATLTLLNDRYQFRSLRLEHRSALLGEGAVVHVKGPVVTEPAVVLTGSAISTPATKGVAISIGVGSLLDSVLLEAVNATVHLHRNVVLGLNVSVVADRIEVAPVTFVIPGASPGQ